MVITPEPAADFHDKMAGMQRRTSWTRIILVISGLLLSATVSASAQGAIPTVGGIELTPSVTNPMPGQSVTITARSYSIDIYSANLTWTVGGKTVEKGIGSNVITVKAPALGRSLSVDISAVTPSGESLQSSLTLTSGSIDMIVEPAGYKPPTFQGKIAAAYQNDVKIAAIPHLANSAGVEYDPKSLLYRWEQNGDIIESSSGYGKQSLVIPGGAIPRPYVISVTVSTRDGNAQGAGTVSVNPVAPFVKFYKNDPLYGPLYETAINNALYLNSQRETGVVAIPYGFNSPVTGLGDLTMAWVINGRSRPELASNQTVTLRAPEGSVGSTAIELRVTNKRSILQGANGAFRAVFTAAASSSPITF